MNLNSNLSYLVKTNYRSILLLLGLAILFSCRENKTKSISSSQQELSQTERLQKMVLGKWDRTDGNYTIEIGSFSDSTFEASYFNPNPIHIADTKWKLQEGYLYFLIVMDDVDYRGSYYSLGYYPEENGLYGFYYLASTGEKFEVAFEKKQ